LARVQQIDLAFWRRSSGLKEDLPWWLGGC